MRTFELLIVFAALMAVIALVAIAIDWVGLPLRNRRFIPRMYRYSDELVWEQDPVGPPAPGSPMPAAHWQPPHPPFGPPASPPAPVEQPASVPADIAAGLPQPSLHPPVVARLAEAQGASSGATSAGAAGAPVSAQVARSAFSDLLAADDGAGPLDDGEPGHARIAETIPDAPAEAWHPGMPLDARVADRQPTVDVKAERFWKSQAAITRSQSHFDDADRQRMSEGKPPLRRNPRTGEFEAMELVGLRAASKPDAVQMMWPADAIDPWSPA